MELNHRLSKIVETIKSHPDVVAIYLFGSYAKGEQTPMSDVDIAVILDKPTSESEADVGSMATPEIDVVLFHRLPLHIKFEVFKHGKELCERREEVEKEAVRDVITVEGKGTADTTALGDSGQVAVTVIQPSTRGVTLSIKLPKGKFYEFYRGVLSLLEDSFDETEVEIKIEAKKGKIPKSDYENKVKETLIQINAQIVEEKTEE